MTGLTGKVAIVTYLGSADAREGTSTRRCQGRYIRHQPSWREKGC